MTGKLKYEEMKFPIYTNRRVYARELGRKSKKEIPWLLELF